jgi:hypothetical protein
MYLWCHFGVGGYCFSFFLILLINGCSVKLDPKIIWICNASNYFRFGETAMLIYFQMYFPWSKFWIWHDFTQKNCKWAASLGKDGMRSSWLKACLSLGPSDVVGLMPWAGFEGWYTLLLYNLYNNNDKCYRPIGVLTPVQNNIFGVFFDLGAKNSRINFSLQSAKTTG